MILYWYIHWFWITILIVYTSVAEKQEQQESMTTHSSNNVSTATHSSVVQDQNVSKSNTNTTKTNINNTQTIIPPSLNVSISKNKSTWNLSEQIQNDNTNMSVSVIEANVTSTSASLAFNVNGSVDYENLTALESSYKESENESIAPSASDRMAISSGQLSAAGITSITVGCAALVAIVSGVSYLWYRNRSFNRPQVLSDRCSNLDSSGYIDDTSDNSEEMYSLDNDSFLNSLEAMTIQNYWTDTVKHTKL